MISIDGGPAFPCEIESGPNMFGDRAPPQSCEGMSLRDWFAGRAQPPHDEATADWLADSLGWPRPTFPVDDRRAWFLWWNEAESAWNYAKADAMLKAREEGK